MSCWLNCNLQQEEVPGARHLMEFCKNGLFTAPIKVLHSVFLRFPEVVLDEHEDGAEGRDTGSLRLGARAREKADKISWWTDRSSIELYFLVELNDSHVAHKTEII